MNDKMLYTSAGFFFSILNIIALQHGYAIVGLYFGLVSFGLFIKAIRTKV